MSSIHQEITLLATPKQVFHALMDSDAHSAFTGAPAVISPDTGGAWSAYGGHITGLNIEVSEGRIVQAWRAANWAPGVYSLVSLELQPEGGATRVVLNHTACPTGTREHLEVGWTNNYWTPLATLFGAADGRVD